MKKAILMIAIAAILTACNNNDAQNANVDNPVTATASTPDVLLGKEWKLSELNGVPRVPDTTFPKKPLLIFENESRISGNLGCNGFGGNYELQENNSIKFSDIAATQMACPNLEIEQSFLEALNTTKSFRIENNTLLFSNEKQEVIAKLEAAE